MRLKLNEKAPDFELFNEEGCTVALSDFHGMWVLLYFYPKDDTPGCTKEAETLRDFYDELSARDVVVLGVSTDSPKSHTRFKEKLNLPFSLLADTEGEVCELYSALNENGRAKRLSFLINPDGLLVKIYNEVRPAEHPQEVLEDLAEFQEL